MNKYIFTKLLYKFSPHISLKILDYLLPRDVLAKINTQMTAGGGIIC